MTSSGLRLFGLRIGGIGSGRVRPRTPAVSGPVKKVGDGGAVLELELEVELEVELDVELDEEEEVLELMVTPVCPGSAWTSPWPSPWASMTPIWTVCPFTSPEPVMVTPPVLVIFE